MLEQLYNRPYSPTFELESLSIKKIGETPFYYDLITLKWLLGTSNEAGIYDTRNMRKTLKRAA